VPLDASACASMRRDLYLNLYLYGTVTVICDSDDVPNCAPDDDDVPVLVNVVPDDWLLLIDCTMPLASNVTVSPVD
jgi:hypothetical protein